MNINSVYSSENPKLITTNAILASWSDISIIYGFFKHFT